METLVSQDRSVLQLPVVYEKPVFEKQVEMVFPLEVVEAFNGGRFCVQCSSCHGCK